MARIYLSSTYRDLVEQREAVYHALRELGHDVVAMEDYVATDARPVDKCLADVAAADLYVGVFAWRYGFVPDRDNPERRSVTEMEYRQAERSGVPRLVFVLRADAPWPPTFLDSQTGENDAGTRIARLRQELSVDRLTSDFGSSEELARKVAAAVQVRGAEPPLRLDPDLPRRRFVRHMRAYAGAMSDRQAETRYVDLVVQQRGAGPAKVARVPVGPLSSFTTGDHLLVAPHGSGKTTVLLHEAQRGPLALYVSLRGFRAGDADTVLEITAEQNRLHAGRLTSSWRTGGDRIRLLVDDADQQTDPAVVAAALAGLRGDRAPANAMTVAVTAPAALLDATELHLLPMTRELVPAFLDAYGRDDLSAAVRSRAVTSRLLRQPDLAAAWAQMPRGPAIARPSLTGILDTQLRGLLAEVGRSFDVERVVTPVLGLLAYRLHVGGQPALTVDDGLLGDVAEVLEVAYRRHHRRRTVMPADWSAEMMLDAVGGSAVVQLTDGQLSFGRPRFADWYAARHAAAPGTDTAAAVRDLARAGAEGALVHLLDVLPAVARFVDIVAETDSRLAQRVWLAGGDGRRAPSALQREFDRLVAELGDRPAEPDARLVTGPRDLATIVTAIGPATPVSLLIDLAGHEHPLIRGLAEYLLLNTLETDTPPMTLTGHGGFTLALHGAGEATLAGWRLLAVPAGTVATVRVTVEQSDADVTTAAGTHLRLLPKPAAATAARTLSDGPDPDWLRCLATACAVARLSDAAVWLATRRGGRADLAGRLAQRAADHAALASVIGADLGLAVPGLPPFPAAAAAVAENAYRRLRRTFAPGAEVSPAGPRIEGTVSVEQNRGSVIGISADEMTVRSDYDDGYYIADLAEMTSATAAEQVVGGALRGIVVGTLHGSAEPLPIVLRAAVRITAEQVVDGMISAVEFHRVTGTYPNCEIECQIAVEQLIGASSLTGVVIGRY